MFFELSKLLNFFLFPVTWIVALLIGSMALRKYPWVRKLCLWGSAVLFLVFTNGPLFDLAKSSMIEEYRFPHWEEGKIYRVAIVMGGFAGMNKERGILQYEQNRADRLWEAVRLFRTGKVNRILITGDPSSSLKPDGSSMDTEFLRYMQEHGIPPDIFLLEQQARNSKENAAYSVAMLSSLGIPDRDCLPYHVRNTYGACTGLFFRSGLAPGLVSRRPHDTFGLPELPLFLSLMGNCHKMAGII